MDYPKHLSDPIRIDVANNYLKGEMEKILPTANLKDLDTLWQRYGPRDYWNGWWGIAMGYKLKLSFVQVLTAENVVWQKRELKLDDELSAGGDLTYISSELNQKRPRASHLKEFFQQHPNLTKKWKDELSSHGSVKRDSLLITATEGTDSGQKIVSVHDGNRRLILASIARSDSIQGYVGSYITAEYIPRNYWLPTSFFMELVLEGELGNAYTETLELLKKILPLSESGEYELRERVLIGKNNFRMKLRSDLGW